MKHDRIDVFFAVYAVAFLAFFSVIALRYHEVLLIPGGVLRHLLTAGYLTWLLDERLPAVPYEETLVGVTLLVAVLSGLVLVLGILYTLIPRVGQNPLRKVRVLGALCVGAILYGCIRFALYHLALHERLYMPLIPVAILAGTLLVIPWWSRGGRLQREGKGD